MHHAWQIEDIWFLILRHLEPRDLGRLAQTCRLLFEIASNGLWNTITDFSVFLYPLPEDCMRRWLRQEDVRRLDFYASKIQHIDLQGFSDEKPMRPPEKFGRLSSGYSMGLKKSWEVLWQDVAAQRATNFEFLPNLHRLRIDNVTEEVIFPLVGISGIHLEQLSIWNIRHNKTSPNVLHMLERFQATPKLEKLCVRDGEDSMLPLKLIQQSPLNHLWLEPRAHAAYYNTPLPIQHGLRAEVFRKSTLQRLDIGLTRDWYFPEVESIRPYLPCLKALVLDLTKFWPSSAPCPNAHVNSWTCAKKSEYASDRDCGRRSPTLFFRGLDTLELSSLEIKFPCDTTAIMFNDVVSAARESCRLDSLTELGFSGGGGSHGSCWGCWTRTIPRLSSAELRNSLRMLLPLPHLKTLRISVVPNFLEIFDLDAYRKVADALPALQGLWLGHAGFNRQDGFIPMRHVAAFCSMLPHLEELHVGAIDGLGLDEDPEVRWQCASIRTVRVANWVRRSVTRPVPEPETLIDLNLLAYFPNADSRKERAC
ncbi:hypothetical protein K491DRAFT_713415 [Lophiostoma macrostomum CBS 122681]|uniref:F-box domain-containing protein n=1 Tax=Lophiostoma macrostomum CBS 122681 TaxID=1314788 RepID=A0A6A6TFD2_9PLEO|nr:hypothetical protein K491DRAFT_713415 [Lophiostoma macrostomum CBS 122681]